MVLTILFAAPGLLVLLLLAASPLFALWDDHAGERAARPDVEPVPHVAIPAPRDPVRPVVAAR